LLSQTQKQHEYLYWEFHEGPRSKQALRNGDWKAVRFGGPGQPVELYNLKSDLAERHNVAGDHPEVVAKMEILLRNARTESPTWPLKGHSPIQAVKGAKR
jgi:hypothetical protein